MQKDEPLIHVLYSGFQNLLLLLLAHVLKPAVSIKKSLNEGKLNSLLEDSNNFLGLQNIDCGETYRVPITEKLVKLSENAHKSYMSYLEEKRRLAEEVTQRKGKESERNTKEKAQLERIEKANKSVKELESHLKILQESYKKAAEASESKQKVVNKILSDAIKSKDIIKTTVVKEMYSGLEKIRKQEKEKETRCDGQIKFKH